MRGRRNATSHRARRGRWGAIALSAVAHIVVLAALGLAVPELRIPPYRPAPPDLQITLERLFVTPSGGPRPPRTSQNRAGEARSVSPQPPILHRPVLRMGEAPRALAPPASPRVRALVLPTLRPGPPASGAPASPAGPGTPANVAGPESGSGMRAYGRATIGCDTADLSRLSAAERERCSQRFGAQAGQGPGIDGIAPLKRAEFAAAAERSCARHFYKAPVPMVASTDRNEERYERGDTIPLSGRMFEAPENVTRWAYCPPGGP